VSDGIDLRLRQGNVASIAVSSSRPECRDKIFIGVVDGVLKIYYDDEKGIKWGKNRHLTVYVTCESFDALTTSSGANVNISGLLTRNSLKLTASYGSDIVGALKFIKLDAAASAGSEITLSGKVAIANIDCRGGATIKSVSQNSGGSKKII
jgi:hypothetical protein